MLTLLTTANFPDVMLPAYYESRINCLFFIGYLVFGLYFLQNILLAVVFDNYKRQLVEKVDHHTETRVQYISEYFDSFDRDKKGVLSLAKGK
jgi:two pore calcium channel protein